MIKILLLSFLIIPAILSAGTPAEGFLKKSDDWFRSDEGIKTTNCILSWQAPTGSWPKNTDTTGTKYSGKSSKLSGTFDNGATTGELRFLASAFNATKEERCKDAFLLGFDHIITAQYPNGGWPQYYPLSKKYHRHITFNDGSMARLMVFLRDVATSDTYDFVDKNRRRAAEEAFDRGVDCIVKSQIFVNGTPTVWCAQHDEVTLKPALARSYELPSLSGSEGGGLLLLLMSIEKPSPEIIRAVEAGAAWFESAKLTGLRFVKSDGERKLIKDPSAPPIWARFYEIETNRPFFCGRDGVVKYDISEIEAERRNGYAWYGNWGDKVASAYAKWPAAKKLKSR